MKPNLRASDLGFDYVIKRSARRKTASIQIDAGEVCVRVPIFAEEEWIAGWVESKAGWIKPRLVSQINAHRKHQIDLSRGEVPISGVVFPIIESKLKGRKVAQVNATNRCLEIDIEGGLQGCDRTQLERKVKASLHAYAQRELTERVVQCASDTGLQPTSVEIRTYRRKWGQCTARGKVSLNWRCIHLSQALQDYVVIHELCHLREMNHSARFWSLVQSYCPNYTELRQEMRRYGPYLDW